MSGGSQPRCVHLFTLKPDSESIHDCCSAQNTEEQPAAYLGESINEDSQKQYHNCNLWESRRKNVDDREGVVRISP